MTINDGKNIRDSTNTDVIYFKGRATVNQTKSRNDLLVIELTIQNIDVARILIDTGSLANIIFKSTLERMKIDPSKIAENPSPLVGLSGETTLDLGSINLIVKAGTMEKNHIVPSCRQTCIIQRNHGHAVVESYACNSINVPSLPLVLNPSRNRDDLGKLEGITSLLRHRTKTKKIRFRNHS